MTTTREVAEKIIRESVCNHGPGAECSEYHEENITSRIDAALKQAIKDEREAKWLPIESAPKDNSWILSLMRSGRQVVVRWGGGTWEDDNRLCRDPVQWMPLPPVPSGKGAGDGK